MYRYESTSYSLQRAIRRSLDLDVENACIRLVYRCCISELGFGFCSLRDENLAFPFFRPLSEVICRFCHVSYPLSIKGWYILWRTCLTRSHVSPLSFAYFARNSGSRFSLYQPLYLLFRLPALKLIGRFGLVGESRASIDNAACFLFHAKVNAGGAAMKPVYACHFVFSSRLNLTIAYSMKTG